MKSFSIRIALAVFCALACSSPGLAQTQQPAGGAAAPVRVTVYKNPSCGCCTNWIEHLRSHGFTVDANDESDMDGVKKKYNVPDALTSCHTALVAGYVIEGHVPADVIDKLLKERPKIAGLAVPGMPIGAPGMEMQGREPQHFDVMAFTHDGKVSVYATR